MYARNWTRLALAALTGLLGVACHSMDCAAAQRKFVLRPRWEKGQRVSYDVVKHRGSKRGDQQLMDVTTRMPLRLEVMSFSTSGSVLSWRFGSVKFQGLEGANDPVMNKMGNLLANRQILLSFNSGGELDAVMNWRELKLSTETMLGTWFEQLKRARADQTALEQLRAQLAAMTASQTAVEQFCASEARLFFQPLGVVFTSSRTVETPGEVPHPFGGQPFPSRVRWVLKSFDKAEGVVKIEWTQSVDPKDTVPLLSDAPKKPDGQGADAGLSIREQAEYEVEVASGWTRRLSYTRTSGNGPVTQEDRLTITPADEVD